MLSLQLKSGEYLTIGDDIAVQIFQQPGGAFSVAVKAPREVPILRSSVLERSGESRPDGLLDRKPKRPSVRARNARNMEDFARRKEKRTEAVAEMRRVLDRMEKNGDGAFQKELEALRTLTDRIDAAQTK